MRDIDFPTRTRRRPRCVEGCCAFKLRSAKRLKAQAIDVQGNVTKISHSSYVYDAMGRRLKKTVKDETGKERITYYGWDSDRLVHTERIKENGMRDIVHTVYEPGTFTPMLRLSTNAKGDPQAKPHLIVQAAKVVVPEQQQDDANTTTALQGLQGAMSGMPEAMRKMLEQGMKQALQGGLSPMAKSIMGGMGIDPDALIQSMNKGIEEERRKEQTPIDILFYHCDHLGTPIALTDQKGQIAWAAKHDPWGNQEEEFNPRCIEQDIRLPGQHLDRETGLYYNYRRYYDPAIGSYVNQDPIGLVGGVNYYNYPTDPTRWVDPLGLWSMPGHNYFIDEFAKNKSLSPKDIEAIKLGSEYADAPKYQVGHDYVHAMRASDNESKEVAQAKACAYFKAHMSAYKLNLENGRTRDAYISLGMALHTVMDSTSPVHAWKPMRVKDLKYHGEGGRTLESEAVARRPAYRDSTVDAMNKAMLGCVDFCK